MMNSNSFAVLLVTVHWLFYNSQDGLKSSHTFCMKIHAFNDFTRSIVMNVAQVF